MSTFRAFKQIRLFLFFGVATACFASEKITTLNSSRVMRRSQGLLNWHIQTKLQSEHDLTRSELCFLKVEKENAPATLELYLKRCPANSSAETLSAFRRDQKKANTFLLSPRLTSTAASELTKLQQSYAAEWTRIRPRYIDEANQNVATDSLGQLVFLPLGDQKINVGHLDASNQLLDLCSGAWTTLCYFNSDLARFELGQETIVYNFDDPNYDQKSNWEWKREYYDFIELVSASVFSRGNDDSRDQAFYTLTLSDGKKIPISEEWYFYFSLNEQTKSLVQKSTELSHRTRNEWNYLTAIHPLHILKVKKRGSDEISYKLYMGASVFYRKDLQIEDEDCDMAETEGFRIMPLEDLARAPVIGEGSFYSDLERKMLYQSLDSFMPDQGDGTLIKNQDAEYLKFKKTSDHFRFSQQKYIPPLEIHSTLTLFGMTAEKALGPNLSENVFAILKQVYGMGEIDDGNSPAWTKTPENRYRLASEFNQNQIKEYLSLEKEGSRFRIKLIGFNPNDFLSTNTSLATFPSTAEKLHFDAQAIYPLWNSFSEAYEPSQVVSRDVAESLKKLKVALNIQRYKNDRPNGVAPKNKVSDMVAALESGQSLSSEEKNQFIGDLDNRYRLVGKNVYKQFGVVGRADLLKRLSSNAQFDLSREMKDARWIFPTQYLVQEFQNENDTRVALPEKIIELDARQIKCLQDFLQFSGKYTNLSELILTDSKKINDWVLTNPHALSAITQEQDLLRSVSDKFEMLAHSENSYFTTMRLLSQTLQRLDGVSAAQQTSLKKLVHLKAKYQSLVKFGLDTRPSDFDAFKISETANTCFVNANTPAKLKQCQDETDAIRQTLNELFTEANLPDARG